MKIAILITEVIQTIFGAMALGVYLAFKDEIHCGLDKLFVKRKGGEG